MADSRSSLRFFFPLLSLALLLLPFGAVRAQQQVDCSVVTPLNLSNTDLFFQSTLQSWFCGRNMVFAYNETTYQVMWGEVPDGIMEIADVLRFSQLFPELAAYIRIVYLQMPFECVNPIEYCSLTLDGLSTYSNAPLPNTHLCTRTFCWFNPGSSCSSFTRNSDSWQSDWNAPQEIVGGVAKIFDSIPSNFLPSFNYDRVFFQAQCKNVSYFLEESISCPLNACSLQTDQPPTQPPTTSTPPPTKAQPTMEPSPRKARPHKTHRLTKIEKTWAGAKTTMDDPSSSSSNRRQSWLGTRKSKAPLSRLVRLLLKRGRRKAAEKSQRDLLGDLQPFGCLGAVDCSFCGDDDNIWTTCSGVDFDSNPICCTCDINPFEFLF